MRTGFFNPPFLVLAKIIILVLLLAMIVSLFAGMYFLVKDRGQTNRTLKALTWRISIWIVLFALMVGAYYSGFLDLHASAAV